MTREELLAVLKLCATARDPEAAHADADAALVAYLNDAEITEAYEAIEKWYA